MFLSLEPILRCPNRRCQAIAYGVSADLITITCRHCGAHWWANRFDAGDIRAQIRAQFEGNDVFIELLDTLGAPEHIDRPMYWQLWISGHDQYAFTNSSNRSGILERSQAFVRGLVSRHRPRSA